MSFGSLSVGFLTLGGLVAGQAYPDALDVLRVEEGSPRLSLLLDSSGSMGRGERETNCAWFGAFHNGGSARLDKNEQMRAVLVGCVHAGDGVLDRWIAGVDFAVFDFGGLRAPFGSTQAVLEAAALSVPARGGTPLSRVLDRSGEYLDEFASDANTSWCQRTYQVLLSDGNPNGGAARFSQECTPPIEVLDVPAGRPWEGADYLFHRHPDVLCGVAGEQQIRTYTIGFGRPGDFNPDNLQRIADEGGGQYFYADTVPELIAAFDQILLTVVAGSQPLAQLSLGQDGYFVDNRAYAVSFEPRPFGPWRGNLRRHCLLPPRTPEGRYDSSVGTCAFRSPDGEILRTNPDVIDQWTGLPVEGTTYGGAGEILRARLGDGAPSAPYWTRRAIVTWRPGQAGWVPVRPDTWAEVDAHVHGCTRFELLNRLHGYTQEADCESGAPLALEDWPIGDAVHAPPLELRYGACDAEDGAPIPGACFLLLATNWGVLHVLDAATGEETSAIVPAELWRPAGVARNHLEDLSNQPSLQYSHRYYIDGVPKLVHRDADGDGHIDSNELAHVVLSLGRGGRAYYALDVSAMSDGVVDAGTPIRSVLPTPGTAFSALEETWAAPLVGDLRQENGSQPVLVLVTGHDPRFDITERTSPPEGGLEFLDERITGAVERVPCSGPDGLAAFNGYPPGGLCQDQYRPGCDGTPALPCYDGAGVPLDLVTPLTYSDDGHQAAALRFYFDEMDLGPGDVLRLEDGQGELVAAYRGQDRASAFSDWVYSPRAALRLVTDGVDSAHRGYSISEIEWEAGTSLHELTPSAAPPPVLGVDHRPALLVLDLERVVSAAPFGASTSDALILLKVARSCEGFSGACLDRAAAPDLEHLVCPISGEPTAFLRDDRIEAIYFGDECGQIFKVYTPDSGATWTARRLLNLNRGEVNVSKDHRKIFRQLDIVESMCPGREVVGIYFGTGNVQRPLARDELERPAATNGRDVIGVLWDHPGLPSDLTQDDLVDATNISAVEPRLLFADGQAGWILSLGENERMIHDPFVFNGTAFFPTFQPGEQGEVCEAASGTDRVYAVDNCTAEAVSGARAPADRVAWSARADYGADLVFVAPKAGIAFVSHGDLATEQSASMGRSIDRRPGLMLFREVP